MNGSDMKSTTLRSRQFVATIPSSSGLTFDFQMVVSAKSLTPKLDGLVMLLYKHYVRQPKLRHQAPLKPYQPK